MDEKGIDPLSQEFVLIKVPAHIESAVSASRVARLENSLEFAVTLTVIEALA